MIRYKVDMTGIKKAAEKMGAMPAQIQRARKSAMSSTAWMAMTELRNHVEYGGSGWPALHPMTLLYRKRKASTPGTPLFWMGRFARYRVAEDGTLADIDFGKSKRGRPGTFDPQLLSMVRRHEQGEAVRVTPKMRRFFGATRSRIRSKAGRKAAIPGRDYFPLRKSTQFIRIPARPIFAPVWRKISPRIGHYFETKFQAAIARYMAR